jgi:hypothetical protein
MRYKSLFFVVTMMLIWVLAVAGRSLGPAPGQRTFATPHQGARAVLTAAEADDVAALMRIFGSSAEEILHSGDAVQDNQNRERFVKRAKQSMKEKISPANPNYATVLIGADNFPFPVPLRRAGGRWYFNTEEGKKEILARRIGSNELDAIAGCKAFVEAEYDYASEDRNKNGVPEYARKLISSPGTRDGLFWPGDESLQTQFAERVREAEEEGYRKQGETPIPYHGYYYRILTAQGPHARGGSLEYVHKGSMIGGFALVSWPAEYRVSGVKTFMVNQHGVIYEKDLGASTSEIAKAMKTFDPDPTWHRVR